MDQEEKKSEDFEENQSETIDLLQSKYEERLAEKDKEIAKLQADIIAKNNTIKNILNQQPTAEGEDAEYLEIMKKLKFIK